MTRARESASVVDMRTIEVDELGATANEVIDSVWRDGNDVVVTIGGVPAARITGIAPPIALETRKGLLSEPETDEPPYDIAEIEALAAYVSEGWTSPLSLSEAVIAQRR